MAGSTTLLPQHKLQQQPKKAQHQSQIKGGERAAAAIPALKWFHTSTGQRHRKGDSKSVPIFPGQLFQGQTTSKKKPPFSEEKRGHPKNRFKYSLENGSCESHTIQSP
jgi:hypothetical protein